LLELLGAGGKEPVGGALEEEERRLGLERRVVRDELAVPRLELGHVLLLLFGEALEHLTAAGALAARPVRQFSQVPNTCSTLCAGSNWRAPATSSISASMSELRNSNDWLQVLQIRWKCRGWR